MKNLKFKRVPGDTIVVPMLIGVVLNSFVPQALQIGGFFTGMVTGTSALVGVFLLFMGATIDVKSTPKAIKIGAVIIGLPGHHQRRIGGQQRPLLGHCLPI